MPNVLYWREFRRVIVGASWPRDEAGIFDRTHLRWFAERDALELVLQAGLQIEEFVPGYWAGGLHLKLLRTGVAAPLRRFTAAQFLIRARKSGPSAGAA